MVSYFTVRMLRINHPATQNISVVWSLFLQYVHPRVLSECWDVLLEWTNTLTKTSVFLFCRESQRLFCKKIILSGAVQQLCLLPRTKKTCGMEECFSVWGTWRSTRRDVMSSTYLLTYLLAYSMEHSLSWEANRFSASQEIPCILWNPKVH